MAQQQRAQAGHALERRAVRQRRPTRRSARRRSTVRHLPSASKFSSANPSGSIRTWHDRAGRILAVRFHPLAHRPRLRRRRRCPSAPARRAAAAAAARRACSRAAIGRAAPATCGSGYDVTVRMLRLAEQPAADAVGERHAPEVAAVDVRDAVVPRQPLVHERVVGGQQLEHAAVLAQLAADEQLGLLLASRRAGSRRTPGTASASGTTPASLPSSSHWLAKLSTSACERGSRSIRRTCCSSTAGIAAACRAPPRPAARRPECCSTGRTTAATPGRDR